MTNYSGLPNSLAASVVSDEDLNFGADDLRRDATDSDVTEVKPPEAYEPRSYPGPPDAKGALLYQTLKGVAG